MTRVARFSTIFDLVFVTGLAIDVNGDLLAADGDGDRVVGFLAHTRISRAS